MGMFIHNDEEERDKDGRYFSHMDDWDNPDTLEYYPKNKKDK